jgi:hypothetical protein
LCLQDSQQSQQQLRTVPTPVTASTITATWSAIALASHYTTSFMQQSQQAVLQL